MNGTEVSRDLLAAAVGALPADALSGVRQAALDRFLSTGLPTTRHEDWKYTSLASVAGLANEWLGDGKVDAGTDLDRQERNITDAIDAYWIRIGNGTANYDAAELAGTGVTVTQLTATVDEATIAYGDPLSAFNAALLRDGLHIRVAPGASLDKPLGILFADDGSQAVTQARIIVELEAGAALQVVESVISGGNGGQLLNAVMQVTLARDARLDLVRMQQRASSHSTINRLSAGLDAGAALDYSSFDLGGGLTRNDVVADIAGADASVSLRGLYLAGDAQHIDNHTRVDHRVGPARSSETYRGILNGRSRAVFNGKAVVHAGADGTDADQSNHNLLLSEQAEIDTKPELEIYADDVKCSHGATVGQLDESALFYLRSRGLSEAVATQALTRAFASAVLSDLPVVQCHEFLAAAIDHKLDELTGGDTQTP